MKKKFDCTAILLVLLSILVSGCDRPSLNADSPTNNDSEIVLQSEVVGQEALQEFDLDNCDGKADVTRVEHRSFSVDVTVSAELAAKIGASAEIVSAEVQASVGTELQIGDERETSIELIAPPNTHMYFQLAWTGDSKVGVVQNVRDSGIPIAFQAFTPTDVRLKSQFDVGCPTQGTESEQDTPSMLPTASPDTEPYESKYPCPLLIKQEIVDDWKIGQTGVPAVDEAIDDFNSFRPQNEGYFIANTLIPAGVIVATNFDEQDANKWTQYQVIPLIHSGSYGLFQTIGEYNAPNAGACMTIIP